MSLTVTNLNERAFVGLSVEDPDDAVVLARRDDSVGNVDAGDVMAHHLPTVVPTVTVQSDSVGNVDAGDVMTHHLPTVVPTVAVQSERIEIVR